MGDIYRKAALERLSSPEELDSLMQVTTPKGWLALLSLGGLIIVALLWGVFGRVPTKISGQGMILERIGASHLEAVLYFAPIHGKKARPGMKVLVSPIWTRQEESGAIVGVVTLVSESPATPQAMMRILQSEKLVQALSSPIAPLEVHADLTPDPTTKSGYKWSSRKGPSMRIESWTPCHAEIIVEEQSPLSLAIPIISNLLPEVSQEGSEEARQ